MHNELKLVSNLSFPTMLVNDLISEFEERLLYKFCYVLLEHYGKIFNLV